MAGERWDAFPGASPGARDRWAAVAAPPAEAPGARRAGAGGWTDAYLRVRGHERRLYPDSIVIGLPTVPAGDPLRGEWRCRADSSARLVGYLQGRRSPVVLEVGCGNGWLANLLAGIRGSRVVGLDVNDVELAQAARVFHAPNLRFVRGDVLDMPPPPDRPDIIVLASVIQYLPDLASLVAGLRPWLAPGGEIHLLDSPLYRPDQLDAARDRTRRHYRSVGVPEMADAYHHHSWRALDDSGFDILYRPDGLRTRVERRLLRRPRSPFPWVRIRAAR